jgi:hypothetical protein
MTNEAVTKSNAEQTSAAVQNPLTLVMTMASSQAAQAVLATLQKVQSGPPGSNPIVNALNQLRNVHFARFVILNDATQLAVITTYDGAFEAYINEFIDSIGDVFNALLPYMKDAPPVPVQQNRDAFLAYVKANDIPSIGFYSAYPSSTVLDIQAALPAH